MNTKKFTKNIGLFVMLISISFSLRAQNLLTADPDFEGGTASSFDYKWYTGSSPNITRETNSPQHGTSYAKAITTAAGNYWDLGMSNFQSLNPVLEVGKTYVLTYYYQNSAGHSFQVGLQDNTGKAPYDFFQTVTTTATSWTLGTYEFTVSAALIDAANDVRLKFQFGKDVGTTLIDNVTLISKAPPVPSANMVLNNSFETNNGGSGLFLNWTTQAAAGSTITAGTASPQDGLRYLRADVTGVNANAYDVQAYTDNFTVVPGHNYSISFWYKSNKKIRMVLQDGSYSYYNAPADIPASATPTVWTKYEYLWNYGSSQTATAISLKFHLALDNGFVELDNVSVNDLSALPVTLISFSAKPSMSSVVLNWATSSEIDNNHYQILRAGDDKIFSSLINVNAKNKASVYSFEDKAPLKGNNYYKLLQFDNNGTVSDLGIQGVKFDFSNADGISVYPNPASEQLSINLGNYLGTKVTMALIDNTGRVVLKKTITNPTNITTLQLPLGLVAGIYNIRLTGDGLEKTSRIVIQ